MSVCLSVCLCVVQGDGGHTQLYLDRLFKSLESFYHPSNNGRWNVRFLLTDNICHIDISKYASK